MHDEHITRLLQLTTTTITPRNHDQRMIDSYCSRGVTLVILLTDATSTYIYVYIYIYTYI